MLNRPSLQSSIIIRARFIPPSRHTQPPSLQPAQPYRGISPFISNKVVIKPSIEPMNPSLFPPSDDDSSDKDCSITQATRPRIDPFLQFLNSHHFIHNQTLEDTIASHYMLIALTPHMKRCLQKVGRVCTVLLLDGCLRSARGHDRVCLLVGLNENLMPQVLSIQTFNGTRVSLPSAIAMHLEFLNQKVSYAPHKMFLPSSLHEAVNRYSCFSGLPISLTSTPSEIEARLRKMFLPEPTTSRQLNISRQLTTLSSVHRLAEDNDWGYCEAILLKLKRQNWQGYQSFIKEEMEKKELFSLTPDFTGFMGFRRYFRAIERFGKTLGAQNHSSEQSVIEAILSEARKQSRSNKGHGWDHLVEKDPQLQRMMAKYEPQPFGEFLRNYSKSMRVREKRASSFMYIMSNPKGTPYVVEKTENLFQETPSFDWHCECNFLAKTGIPCEHLIRVLQIEKLAIDQDIAECYYRRSSIVVIDPK